MRNLISGLLLTLSGTMTSAEGILDLTTPEREVLHSEIRQYLLENPEIIVEVISLLEERNRNQQVQNDVDLVAANTETLYNDGFSFATENSEATLTIVEFSDYQCGYCKRAHPDIQALLDERDDVRLIVKEFPILGPVSEFAARAALAVLEVDGPEVYEKFNDTMMTHSGRLNERIINQIAENVGADVEKMQVAMASDEITTKVESTLALAREMQVSGTPAFVIGEKVLRGYLPLEDLRQVVEGELAKM